MTTPDQSNNTATTIEVSTTPTPWPYGPAGERLQALGGPLAGVFTDAMLELATATQQSQRPQIMFIPVPGPERIIERPVSMPCHCHGHTSVTTRVVDSFVSLWVLLVTALVFLVMWGGLEWVTDLDHGKTAIYAGLIAAAVFVTGLFTQRRVTQ